MSSQFNSISSSNKLGFRLSWSSSLPRLPSQPGVYWFLDAEKKVLYVGKAKNLKKRVQNYTHLQQLSSEKRKMVLEAESLKHQTLENELEALLIEAELIHLHQPPYNVLLKDDKSPIYIVVEDKHFPAVKLVRKTDLPQYGSSSEILGPFSSAYKLKQVLRIARKLFPWCDKAEHLDTKQEVSKNNLKPCFYHHLQLCPGACTGEISSSSYQHTIKQLTLFLKGKKKEILQQLTKEMQELSKQHHFEEAAKLRDKINLIRDVTSSRFKLKPDLILPALHDSASLNALDHLRRILQDLAVISRQATLHRIEGYDVSNLMGNSAAVSMVVFTDGQLDKAEYRLFNIRDLNTPNDYQMMKQAIKRRLNHPEWQIADLIIVDGGKGQVRSALNAFQEAGLEPHPPIIGIAKKPDRLIIPVSIDSPKNSSQLQVKYQVVNLPQDHPALHLVQQVRDESHRFAKNQHSRLRQKKTLYN